MSQADLTAALPETLRPRVVSLGFKHGRAMVVLDVAGMDAEARDAAERDIKDALMAQDSVEEVRLAMTAQKKHRRIIAVGSGKGGVGKSTLTANLAIALKRAGHAVGVVDADIYGPSQPTLLGNSGHKPEAEDKTLIPVPSPHGIPVLSMGHLVEGGTAIAWRGPMVGSALGQLIEADWGETDILLVDLPPGTGDVQLTMLQKYKPAGAVLVSTPQDLALIDAARAGQMFDKGGVPIIGLVENMAGYSCPHCGEISDPFGKGGVEVAAERLDLPFLGRIPLTMAIREDSDAGRPPALRDDETAQPFIAIADKITAWLGANG